MRAAAALPAVADLAALVAAAAQRNADELDAGVGEKTCMMVLEGWSSGSGSQQCRVSAIDHCWTSSIALSSVYVYLLSNGSRIWIKSVARRELDVLAGAQGQGQRQPLGPAPDERGHQPEAAEVLPSAAAAAASPGSARRPSAPGWGRG